MLYIGGMICIGNVERRPRAGRLEENMKRLVPVVITSLALGSVACQKQAEPERAAQAPAAAGAPAEAGAPAASRPASAPGAPAPAHGAVAPPEAVQAAPPAAPAPTPPPVILEAGTSLPIVLQAMVSTKSAQAGDRVLAELAEDLSVDGRVVLAAGSEVRGRVLTAERAGRVKGHAHLVVSFDEVRAGGKAHAIQASRIDVTAASTTGKDVKIAGGAAAAGAVIGGIADGGSGAVKGGLIGGAAGGAAVLATRGGDVELKAGSRHKIELRSSLRLD